MKTKTYTAKTETLLQEQADAFKSNYDFQCNVIDPLRKYGRSKIAVTYRDLDMGKKNTIIERVLNGYDEKTGTDSDVIKSIFDMLADKQFIENPDEAEFTITAKDDSGSIQLCLYNHSKRSSRAIARQIGRIMFGKGNYTMVDGRDYPAGYGGEDYIVNKSGQIYTFGDDYLPNVI